VGRAESADHDRGKLFCCGVRLLSLVGLLVAVGAAQVDFEATGKRDRIKRGNNANGDLLHGFFPPLTKTARR
jgi:hypothetical protein